MASAGSLMIGAERLNTLPPRSSTKWLCVATKAKAIDSGVRRSFAGDHRYHSYQVIARLSSTCPFPKCLDSRVGSERPEAHAQCRLDSVQCNECSSCCHRETDALDLAVASNLGLHLHRRTDANVCGFDLSSMKTVSAER